jgi:hypothetical protein
MPFAMRHFISLLLIMIINPTCDGVSHCTYYAILTLQVTEQYRSVDTKIAGLLFGHKQEEPKKEH